MELKKTGPVIIDQMVGKFQGIVDGLDKDVQLCETKKQKNAEVIETLAKENDFLEQKTEEATTFRDNLKDMLTKKRSSTISSDSKD